MSTAWLEGLFAKGPPRQQPSESAQRSEDSSSGTRCLSCAALEARLQYEIDRNAFLRQENERVKRNLEQLRQNVTTNSGTTTNNLTTHIQRIAQLEAQLQDVGTRLSRTQAENAQLKETLESFGKSKMGEPKNSADPQDARFSLLEVDD